MLECFEWVRNCVKLYTKKHMRIIVQPIPSNICHHVITDKQWLLENLLCLASNSVKFVGESGELRFRVQLNTADQELHSKQSDLLFEVEDDGIGIPEDKMKSLFQPFQQAQRNAGGTGLGLYALANRTQAIGGTYGVRKRDDGKRGVVFWFTVPYRPDSTMTVEELTDFKEVLCCSAKETIGNSSIEDLSFDLCTETLAEPGTRVLLVEDSIMIQKAGARMLRRQGHLVDIAGNGLECVQRIQEQEYDLILMDINMPVMDGLEAIRRIRDDEAAAAMESQTAQRKRHLVIGVSADSDTETREMALKAGMDDFLEKPLDMKRLKEKCLVHHLEL